MSPTRVKVCCIRSVEEARTAVSSGASAIGLVSAMPSGPGVISEERIGEIAASVSPPIATFLLTSATDADAIVDQQRRCRVNTIQLCDRVTAEVHRALRVQLPGIALVQVVHVNGTSAAADALDVARRVDAVLLDSGDPAGAIRELGGTGRTHDWTISARIVRQCPVPVFLAGGLDGDNVAGAIAAVRPFAVDLCSGVRTDGDLDEEKLRAFMAAIPREADG